MRWCLYDECSLSLTKFFLVKLIAEIFYCFLSEILKRDEPGNYRDILNNYFGGFMELKMNMYAPDASYPNMTSLTPMGQVQTTTPPNYYPNMSPYPYYEDMYCNGDMGYFDPFYQKGTEPSSCRYRCSNFPRYCFHYFHFWLYSYYEKRFKVFNIILHWFSIEEMIYFKLFYLQPVSRPKINKVRINKI